MQRVHVYRSVRVKKIMQICQNGPLKKVMLFFLFMPFCISCIVMYSKNLCGTNLCDWHLTSIIRINKIHAEKVMLLYGTYRPDAHTN